MTLVGRDAFRTTQVADELKKLSPASTISVSTADFGDPAAIQAAVAAAVAEGAPDIVLIAHGARADQALCERDLTVCAATLVLNGVSPALWAEAFAAHMEIAARGTLVVIGSISGDRGRKTNYVYGAAKGFLERYAEGLGHRLAAVGVRVLLVKPGPTATPQTRHLEGTGANLAAPDKVARGICSAVRSGKRIVYLPFRWRIVMFAVRNIPTAVFNRLDI